MEIVWLEDLIALAECLNFSRAAKARNITQPAFGRRIRALEAWAGAPLIDRATHRLHLTPSGEVMLIVARDVLRRLEQGRQDVQEMLGASMALRFASTHALSLTFFPEWFRGLGAPAAAMPVHLLADNMKACERLMAQGKVQFLLCHHHPLAEIDLNASDFTWIKLGSDVLIPVCRRGADGKPAFIWPGTEEEPIPLLAFDDGSGMGRIITAALLTQQRAHFVKPIFTSHLAIVLKTLAADGRGVAWTPLSLVQDDLASGALVRAVDDGWNIPIDIVLLRPKERQSAAAEKIWEIIQAKPNKGP